MQRLVFIMTICLAAAAAAQPSPPPPAMVAQWSQQVDDFAVAVLDISDEETMRAMLADGARIESFGGHVVPPSQLQPSLLRYRLLGARGYSLPATTVAEDIASSVESADLPEGLKRAVTPPDRNAAARANGTALQWLTRTLSARDNELVGVVVLIRPPDSSQAELTVQSLAFILVKGAAQNGQFRINTIVFGQPLQER
jgi:hypothetical protein